MPRPEKVQAVEDIRSRIESAQATFLTEYRGLNVGQQQQLRRSLHASGTDYTIVKMTLARLAAGELGIEGIEEWLTGPTALAFAGGDPVESARAFRDFARDHEQLVVKAGILGGRLLLPEQVSKLADVEPRPCSWPSWRVPSKHHSPRPPASSRHSPATPHRWCRSCWRRRLRKKRRQTADGRRRLKML